MSEAVSTHNHDEVRCAQCERILAEGEDRVATQDAVFCQSCYDSLMGQLKEVAAAQGRDINYPRAILGGVGGAAIGIAVWWGFTVVTNIAFGLVAIVIGVAVGKGIVMLSGSKRSQHLQIISVAISAIAFFYASYLVNRTFVNRALAEEGESVVLPLLPAPGLFVEIIGLGFGLMDLVFLAIVVYEAWKIPAPFALVQRQG